MKVTLTFVLDEDVTPDLFAGKVAMACANGCLRPGEGIELPSNPKQVLTVTSGTPLDEPWVKVVNLMDRVTLLRLLVDYCEEYDQHPGSTPTVIDDIADDLMRDIRHTAGVDVEIREVAQARVDAITHHARRARGNVRD